MRSVLSLKFDSYLDDLREDYLTNFRWKSRNLYFGANNFAQCFDGGVSLCVLMHRATEPAQLNRHASIHSSVIHSSIWEEYGVNDDAWSHKATTDVATGDEWQL